MSHGLFPSGNKLYTYSSELYVGSSPKVEALSHLNEQANVQRQWLSSLADTHEAIYDKPIDPHANMNNITSLSKSTHLSDLEEKPQRRVEDIHLRMFQTNSIRGHSDALNVIHSLTSELAKAPLSVSLTSSSAALTKKANAILYGYESHLTEGVPTKTSHSTHTQPPTHTRVRRVVPSDPRGSDRVALMVPAFSSELEAFKFWTSALQWGRQEHTDSDDSEDEDSCASVFGPSASTDPSLSNVATQRLFLRCVGDSVSALYQRLLAHTHAQRTQWTSRGGRVSAEDLGQGLMQCLGDGSMKTEVLTRMQHTHTRNAHSRFERYKSSKLASVSASASGAGRTQGRGPMSSQWLHSHYTYKGFRAQLHDVDEVLDKVNYNSMPERVDESVATETETETVGVGVKEGEEPEQDSNTEVDIPPPHTLHTVHSYQQHIDTHTPSLSLSPSPSSMPPVSVSVSDTAAAAQSTLHRVWNEWDGRLGTEQSDSVVSVSVHQDMGRALAQVLREHNAQAHIHTDNPPDSLQPFRSSLHDSSSLTLPPPPPSEVYPTFPSLPDFTSLAANLHTAPSQPLALFHPAPLVLLPLAGGIPFGPQALDVVPPVPVDAHREWCFVDGIDERYIPSASLINTTEDVEVLKVLQGQSSKRYVSSLANSHYQLPYCKTPNNFDYVKYFGGGATTLEGMVKHRNHLSQYQDKTPRLAGLAGQGWVNTLLYLAQQPPKTNTKTARGSAGEGVDSEVSSAGVLSMVAQFSATDLSRVLIAIAAHTPTIPLRNLSVGSMLRDVNDVDCTSDESWVNFMSGSLDVTVSHHPASPYQFWTHTPRTDLSRYVVPTLPPHKVGVQAWFVSEENTPPPPKPHHAWVRQFSTALTAGYRAVVGMDKPAWDFSSIADDSDLEDTTSNNSSPRPSSTVPTSLSRQSSGHRPYKLSSSLHNVRSPRTLDEPSLSRTNSNNVSQPGSRASMDRDRERDKEKEKEKEGYRVGQSGVSPRSATGEMSRPGSVADKRPHVRATSVGFVGYGDDDKPDEHSPRSKAKSPRSGHNRASSLSKNTRVDTRIDRGSGRRYHRLMHPELRFHIDKSIELVQAHTELHLRHGEVVDDTVVGGVGKTGGRFGEEEVKDTASQFQSRRQSVVTSVQAEEPPTWAETHLEGDGRDIHDDRDVDVTNIPALLFAGIADDNSQHTVDSTEPSVSSVPSTQRGDNTLTVASPTTVVSASATTVGVDPLDVSKHEFKTTLISRIQRVWDFFGLDLFDRHLWLQRASATPHRMNGFLSCWEHVMDIIAVRITLTTHLASLWSLVQSAIETRAARANTSKDHNLVQLVESLCELTSHLVRVTASLKMLMLTIYVSYQEKIMYHGKFYTHYMREDHELYSKVFNFIHDAKVPLQDELVLFVPLHEWIILYPDDPGFNATQTRKMLAPIFKTLAMDPGWRIKENDKFHTSGDGGEGGVDDEEAYLWNDHLDPDTLPPQLANTPWARGLGNDTLLALNSTLALHSIANDTDSMIMKLLWVLKKGALRMVDEDIEKLKTDSQSNMKTWRKEDDKNDNQTWEHLRVIQTPSINSRLSPNQVVSNDPHKLQLWIKNVCGTTGLLANNHAVSVKMTEDDINKLLAITPRTDDDMPVKGLKRAVNSAWRVEKTRQSAAHMAHRVSQMITFAYETIKSKTDKTVIVVPQTQIEVSKLPPKPLSRPATIGRAEPTNRTQQLMIVSSRYLDESSQPPRQPHSTLKQATQRLQSQFDSTVSNNPTISSSPSEQLPPRNSVFVGAQISAPLLMTQTDSPVSIPNTTTTNNNMLLNRNRSVQQEPRNINTIVQRVGMSISQLAALNTIANIRK